MKKNQICEITIEDMSDSGEGIGRYEGYTLFVKDAVVGDRIRARVTKAGRTYGYGRLEKLLEPSPYRVAPKCPVARQCGGCQLQAMAYEQQLAYKEKKVKAALERIGGLKTVQAWEIGSDEAGLCGKQENDSWHGTDAAGEKDAVGGKGAVGEKDVATGTDRPGIILRPIMGMEHPWRYRNKAQYPVGRDRDGKLVAGFYAGRTHAIISCTDCLLGAESDKLVLETVLEYMEQEGVEPYDEAAGTGLVRHVLVRTGYHTGQVLVCLVVNGRTVPRPKRLAEMLKKAVPNLAGLCLNVNTARSNVILGQELIPVWGQQYLTDRIGDVEFAISPLSFFQINPMQTERLYGKALEYAGLTGNEVVWDLYCGIGTISLFLARQAKQVYGVEIVPQAVDNARENAVRNGITNAAFFVGKAEEVLPRIYEEQGVKADVIVVDPPRKGCDERLLKTIVQMSPGRVVYVSCNPATLARDLKYMGEHGYETVEVTPCDMFAQTVHCESVSLLRNRKPDTKVRIDVDLKDYYHIKDSEKTSE